MSGYSNLLFWALLLQSPLSVLGWQLVFSKSMSGSFVSLLAEIICVASAITIVYVEQCYLLPIYLLGGECVYEHFVGIESFRKVQSGQGAGNEATLRQGYKFTIARSCIADQLNQDLLQYLNRALAVLHDGCAPDPARLHLDRVPEFRKELTRISA